MIGEPELWKDMFRGRSPRAIEEAFKAHLKATGFFPRPNDIEREIDLYEERRGFEQGEKDWSDYKKSEAEYLKNGGELLSFAGVIQKFKTITGKEIGRMPVAPIIGDPAECEWATPLNLSSDRKNDAQRRLREWQEKRTKESE